MTFIRCKRCTLLWRQRSRAPLRVVVPAQQSATKGSLCPSSVCLSVSPSVCLSVCLSHFWFAYNFFTFRDRAFIFGMCVPYDKTFPIVPWILITWPCPWPLTYIWKTLTLHITSLSLDIGLSYLACVFLMTRPFWWFHSFDHVTLTVTFDLYLEKN